MKSTKNTRGQDNCGVGAISVSVSDKSGNNAPIQETCVSLFRADDGDKDNLGNWSPSNEKHIRTDVTFNDGCITFHDLKPGFYIVFCDDFKEVNPKCVLVQSDCTENVCIKPDIGFKYSLNYFRNGSQLLNDQPELHDFAKLSVSYNSKLQGKVNIMLDPPIFTQDDSDPSVFVGRIDRLRNLLNIILEIKNSARKLLPHIPDNLRNGSPMQRLPSAIEANPKPEQPVAGNLDVSLMRTKLPATPETAFWLMIQSSVNALSYDNYHKYMELIFCGKTEYSQDFQKITASNSLKDTVTKRFLPFTDTDSYRVIKAATEAFVMVNCGVYSITDEQGNDILTNREAGPRLTNIDEIYNGEYLQESDGKKILPYLAVIRQKLPDLSIKGTSFEAAMQKFIGERSNLNKLDDCYGILQEKLAYPCLLELIWSYWHEEGMLVQSMNAITRRFQNMRSPSAQDPLANLEMDPLRPLNNVLWGYIQDEQHRLTVNRRNYEYDHHYGLRLEGKAVQNFRPADTRSKFLEAFHHLLRLCTVFYKQDDDTTVKADAFPVLNALKEVHLILSQGAHNQFGDLPSTSRVEMLMQQWLLARPEFRELLPTRIMVAYPEPWMDRVDAMKKLQGWSDTSVLHFHNLGRFGEQILLSVRWGNWNKQYEPVNAHIWARIFRPQIQGYIHAYRAATGIDLSVDLTANVPVDSTLPSVLLQKRLASQQRAI